MRNAIVDTPSIRKRLSCATFADVNDKHQRIVHNVTVHRLNELEKNRGLSQREVAAGINMAEQTYSNKKNRIRPFSIKDYIALADFFHVSVDYLMGRDDSDGGAA